jgi:hypothetical protein
MITFEVSHVVSSQARLPTTDVRASMNRLVRGGIDALWHDDPHARFVETEGHGFVEAARLAFSDHLPLEFGPDEVWACIVQGVATHLRLHADALRRLMVSHDGRKPLCVERHDFVRDVAANDWAGFFEDLVASATASATAPGNGPQPACDAPAARLFLDFSTTLPAARTALQIAGLSGLTSWYDYACLTLCGIPRITLKGSVDDWMAMSRRLSDLHGLGLGGWLRSVIAVVDRLAATARGDVDVAFWRSFFKLDDQSGGPNVSGWINALFPYTVTLAGQGYDQVNLPQANAWAQLWDVDMPAHRHHAPACHEFGTGVATVPVTWRLPGDKVDLLACGGFIGVAQDEATRALRPVLGWAMQDGERAARRHDALRAQWAHVPPDAVPGSMEVYVAMRQLYGQRT